MKYPEFLPQNGKIAIIAPSFGCTTEPYLSCFKAALQYLRRSGYEVITGPNVYCDDGIGKSNTPEKCADEINSFFIEAQSDVIISAGGGETMCEDLEFVDFPGISASKPVWYMGYSDNTNLTFTLPTLCDTAAIYGPNAPAYGMQPLHPYLHDALSLISGKKLLVGNYSGFETESLKSIENPYAPLNITEPFSLSLYQNGHLYASTEAGTAFEGRLLGGCLDCLVKLCGTKFDSVGAFNRKYGNDGIVWFLECCDLNVLEMRRCLWQLANAGWFDKASGFLIGRPLHFDEPCMGLDRFSAVTGILGRYGVPIVLDLDIGHLPPQMPLICGAKANIKVCGNSVTVSHRLE